MLLLESFSSILGAIITPAVLLLSSIGVSSEISIPKILRPRYFVKSLTDLPSAASTSPLRALTVALAGTLGVGNITGVASALICGGPGAILWMWVGALVVLGAKYAEVSLAVSFRQKKDGKYFGGAMYYIRDGLRDKLGSKASAIFGGVFAMLCCINSLITGNIVQSNAASCIFPSKYRIYCGVFLGICVTLSLIYGARKVEKITSSLIPVLTAVYIILSVSIVMSNIEYLPKIIGGIFSAAFSKNAIIGGAAGFSAREAIRFGVMRGIFSNEAGCGTSPIAHASADTKSPHHQACYGIFEVIFDTIILCTMTAFVLLIADSKFGIIPWHSEADASPVTLSAFDMLGGSITYYLLCICVVLFAFATIIAQIYYGVISIGYLTSRKIPQIIYFALSAACAVLGSVISSPVMWLSADLIIGIMTAVNCTVIILLRSRLKEQRLMQLPR
ncbi:MAG: alanine:cation symporter family protein [Ruminococcaceae bacterium]|nr:alanine:cation symporter family protein [Oscillospiraceae bacterium]